MGEVVVRYSMYMEPNLNYFKEGVTNMNPDYRIGSRSHDSNPHPNSNYKAKHGPRLTIKGLDTGPITFFLKL